MNTTLRIGVWPHWNQPAYKIASRLKEHFHLDVKEINFKKTGYLKGLDVVIIEQNGYDDYIENEQVRLQEFVRNGGICWIMHQEHERWTPHFLPNELAYPILIHRYFETTAGHWEYIMPWIEEPGRFLFQAQNRISPDEMVYWEMPTNSFDQHRPRKKIEMIKSTALSCIINPKAWEVLGSYRDCAVRDGALIIQARYGKGLFLWNQILFPEIRLKDSHPALAFWDRYIENVLNYFESFKKNRTIPGGTKKRSAGLPKKKNYKMITHIHSLGWWGAGSSPGTINAAMRYHGMDIAVMAVNNAFAFGRPVLDDLKKYCDERVLFLPGQEVHPFNWEGGPNKRLHILNMGTEGFRQDLHKGLFTLKEVDAYVKETIAHIKRAGGCAVATHSCDDYWTRYKFDAVDIGDNMPCGLKGSIIEKYYIAGGKIPVMVPVDMWGIQRLKEYPVFHFIYIDGVPSRKTVLAAVKKGRLMPAIRIESADIRLGKYLPGDTVPLDMAKKEKLFVSVKSQERLERISVFCGRRVIYAEKLNGFYYQKKIGLGGMALKDFLRVEVSGKKCIVISNPFYLNPHVSRAESPP